MRVTFNTAYRNSLDALERAAEDLARRQEVVSSGRRINAPSDDPSGASASIAERAEAATIDRYIQASDSTTSRLTVVDSVLSDIISQLSTAQVAAMSGRGSSATPAQREAAAGRVESIRDAVLSDLNTTFGGAYLFSGTAALAAPFVRQADGTVAAYTGDTLAASVDVDRQVEVQVSFDGDELASGGEASDIFEVLEGLATALRAGDESAITTAIDSVKRAMDRAQRAQSRVGSDLSLLENQKARLGQLKLGANARVAANEDADMAAAISQLTRAETAYRAALGAIGVSKQLSLMDYLR